MRIEPNWADTCSGSTVSALKSFASEFAFPYAMSLNVQSELTVGRPLAVNGERLRDKQQPALNRRSQDEQGRSVFTEATGPIALTAHMGATKRGVSGPYPWRPPV